MELFNPEPAAHARPVSPDLYGEALFEPDRVFAHPQDVVAASDLSTDEKRAVLASWASDAWAVESAPALRRCPGLADRYVTVDAVLDALRSLDSDTAREAGEPPGLECGARGQRIRWLTRPRRPT